MNISHVIKAAVLSEKAYKLMEKGIYTFLVEKNANKNHIAEVIAKQFGVKVAKVNFTATSSKRKRIANTRKFTKIGTGKKAIVYLESGHNISLLTPKKEGKKSKKQVMVKENESKEKDK